MILRSSLWPLGHPQPGEGWLLGSDFLWERPRSEAGVLQVCPGGQGRQALLHKVSLIPVVFPQQNCQVQSDPCAQLLMSSDSPKAPCCNPREELGLLSPQVINPCAVCCSSSHLLYRAGDFSLPQIRICLFLGLPSIKLTFPFLCASMKDAALLSCRQCLKF